VDPGISDSKKPSTPSTVAIVPVGNFPTGYPLPLQFGLGIKLGDRGLAHEVLQRSRRAELILFGKSRA
jgi:hypothetical protein